MKRYKHSRKKKKGPVERHEEIHRLRKEILDKEEGIGNGYRRIKTKVEGEDRKD